MDGIRARMIVSSMLGAGAPDMHKVQVDRRMVDAVGVLSAYVYACLEWEWDNDLSTEYVSGGFRPFELPVLADYCKLTCRATRQALDELQKAGAIMYSEQKCIYKMIYKK